MSETRLWKFPYQYRVKCYDHWHFKIEKWFLGLRMVAWDIVSFVWDRERDAFAKAVGLREASGRDRSIDRVVETEHPSYRRVVRNPKELSRIEEEKGR